MHNPHKFVQWVGHPPLTATRYEQQMLRCSDCQERFEAPLPAGVTPQKYHATADVALVLHKYGQMTPWTRQAEVQELCGLPLAEATQWERCECVGDALLPVKLEMERQAAQAELVGADDTGGKSCRTCKRKRNYRKKNGARRIRRGWWRSARVT